MKSGSKADLKIDLIEKKNALHHPPASHPILPQHEFSMIIVAPKGSGKTNFICNLVKPTVCFTSMCGKANFSRF